MAEGWLTHYWSKLIKLPYFLRVQMRRRERKIVRSLHHMKFLIYDRIPKEVLKEHRVTRALKDDLKVNKEAKKLEREEFQLGFDEEIEETLTLREVKEIERTLLEHEVRHGPTGYERDFGKKINITLIGENAEERKIYFRFLEPIIKVAEKRGDHKALMEEIRHLGSTQTNIFAAMAMRLDIRSASQGISRLRHDKKALQRALAAWDSSKNKQAALQQLEKILKHIEIDIENTLRSDALVAKRDFLLVILTLWYINDDEKMITKYYLKSVMPKLPEQERIIDFEVLKKKLAEDMHVLAQGMRRIFAAEQEAEKLAQEIEVEAQKRR